MFIKGMQIKVTIQSPNSSTHSLMAFTLAVFEPDLHHNNQVTINIKLYQNEKFQIHLDRNSYAGSYPGLVLCADKT
jgi:hypothetical protein